MAEINIEKKKPIWPWIVGVIILAALLYFFVFADNDNDNVSDDATTTEQVMEENNDSMDNSAELSNLAEIDTYLTYITDPKMGVDHEYTEGAITKLIAATRAVANDLNVDVDAHLTEANNKADEITKDPSKIDHANKIKNSGQIINRALKTIQTEKAPQLESEYNDAEATVAKIDPDTQTLQQKDAINAYFRSAGNLLTSIQNNYGQEQ